MQFFVSFGTVGASPQTGDFLTVLSCPGVSLPVLLNPAPSSNRWTDFHALWLKRRVFVQGRSFWGLGRWATSFADNMPPPSSSPKMGGNRQIQAKIPKYKNRKISETTRPTGIRSRPNLRTTLKPTIALRGSNPIWLSAAILKKL